MLPTLSSLTLTNTLQTKKCGNFLKYLRIILHLHLGLLGGLFPSGFPTKTLDAPLLSPYVPHAPPTSFSSNWSYEKYLVSSTYHTAPHYVVFSTLLLHCPALGPNILPNTLFSNTISIRLKRKTVEKQKRLEHCHLPTSMESQQCQTTNLKIGSCALWQVKFSVTAFYCVRRNNNLWVQNLTWHLCALDVHLTADMNGGYMHHAGCEVRTAVIIRSVIFWHASHSLLVHTC